MKIILDNIKEEGLQWAGKVALDNSRLIDGTSCPEQADVSVEIYPVNNYYRIKGNASGKAEFQCSRCLDTFSRSFRLKFEEVIVKEPLSGEELEKELNVDDMNISFNHGEEIELGDIVTEQFLLDLPMKTLCSEDCKGLCPECGENLNKKNCACDKKQDSFDPRLAVLIEYKKKH